MAIERTKVKRYAGVYCREHSSRKHEHKPDKCFEINYRVAGALHWEKVGWASEGYTAQIASHIRGDRIRTLRHGDELPQKKKREITFHESWEKYFEWSKSNRKIFKAEESRYTKHLQPVFGKLTLSEITPLLLEELKNNLAKNKYSDQTVKHILVLVRQIINKSKLWDLWEGENPVTKVKIPKPNNKRERFLTVEEASKLLIELQRVSPQIRDIALLSLDTGMRAGELFDLRWRHLDLENRTIYIGDPKPGEAQHVYITEVAKEMLENRYFNDPRNSLDDFVFISRNGQRMSEVSDTFERTVKKLGFNEGVTDSRQKVCFHTLRHTFASWLAQGETYLPTIQELMRHSTQEMTQRYSHLIPAQKREALDKIENKLRQALNHRKQP